MYAYMFVGKHKFMSKSVSGMHESMHVCICVYVSTYVCQHVQVHTHPWVYMHECMYVCTNTYSYGCKHTCVCVDRNSKISVSMYVCMHINIYAFLQVCRPTWLSVSMFVLGMHGFSCLYVYIYVCMHICMYVCMYKFPNGLCGINTRQMELLLWTPRPDNPTYLQDCTVFVIHLNNINKKMLPIYANFLATRWHTTRSATASYSMKPYEQTMRWGC